MTLAELSIYAFVGVLMGTLPVALGLRAGGESRRPLGLPAVGGPPGGPARVVR